jgi:acyl-CoA thioesterase-1
MDKDILTEASLRAAHFLGLDTAQVAQIKTEAQLESEEVELLLVKTYRSLQVDGEGHTADYGENVDLYSLIWSFFIATDGDRAARNYKILALGDSYTIGESVCDTCRFPEQLKERLISEYTDRDEFSLQIIAQTDWNTTDLKNAIMTAKPANNFDLVTLLVGVNNQCQGKPFEVYETEFGELVDSAISLVGYDVSKLIVVSILDYAFTPFGQNFNPTATSAELVLYNDFAREYCEAVGLSYVYITDITQQGLEPPLLATSDGLHPSELAYTKFVERILPFVLAKVD